VFSAARALASPSPKARASLCVVLAAAAGAGACADRAPAAGLGAGGASTSTTVAATTTTGSSGGMGPCSETVLDCDGDPTNGCETHVLEDRTHCGSCDNVCLALKTCEMGACVFGCYSYSADCNGVPEDGCETFVQVDANNCGTCGHVCASHQCDDGQCALEVLEVGLGYPLGLGVDATHIYWTNDVPSGTLNRRAVGGGPIEVLASNLPHPANLVLDETHVYWTNYGTLPDLLDGSVGMIDKAGGPVTVLASALTAPWAITRDAGFVYWLASGNLGCGDGAIGRVPLGGGAPVTLLSGSLCGADLATDGAELFFFTGDGTVARAPVAGGAITDLSEPLEEPCGLGWMDQDVYYADCAYGFGGTVFKQPKLGGAAVPVADLEAMAVRFGASDGALYWTEWSDYRAGRILRTKGSVTEVFVDGTPEAPYNLAFDATSVYWAELSGGRILRKEKGPAGGP